MYVQYNMNQTSLPLELSTCIDPNHIVFSIYNFVDSLDDHYFKIFETQDGRALLDIGVYALSFVQFFLDSNPVDFKTIVQMHPSGVDDKSTISYTTESGTLANVILSFRGKLPKQGVVACEKAHITFNDYPRADQAIITYADGETEIVKAGDKKEALNYEIENISKSLLTNEDLTNIENTIRVNYLMDRAASEWEMNWIFE